MRRSERGKRKEKLMYIKVGGREKSWFGERGEGVSGGGGGERIFVSSSFTGWDEDEDIYKQRVCV
jgi:hypothetical protein